MRHFARYSYILTSYAIGILIFTLFRLLNTLVYCSGAETWPDFEGEYVGAQRRCRSRQRRRGQ